MNTRFARHLHSLARSFDKDLTFLVGKWQGLFEVSDELTLVFTEA